jgi:hypothetical protein
MQVWIFKVRVQERPCYDPFAVQLAQAATIFLGNASCQALHLESSFGALATDKPQIPFRAKFLPGLAKSSQNFWVVSKTGP